MAWRKPDPALVERFGALVPNVGSVKRRTMFGCPCAFTGDNMFAGVHEDRLILRLDQARRTQLLACGAAAPFAAAGRTMREYVVIEAAAGHPNEELAALTHEAFTYAASLPPKVKRAAKRPAKRKATEAKRAVPRQGRT